MFIYFRCNSVFLYVVKSIFLCLIISFLFAVLIDVFIGIKGVDSPADNISLIDVLGGSIVSPLLETLLLMILVTFFKLFFESDNVKAISVSLVFSYLHNTSVPYWGWITFPSFFIFTISYIVWSEVSTLKGYIVSSLIHFGLNFTSLSMVYIGQEYS